MSKLDDKHLDDIAAGGGSVSDPQQGPGDGSPPDHGNVEDEAPPGGGSTGVEGEGPAGGSSGVGQG